MLETAREYLVQEPIATIGFTLTWIAAALTALFRHLRRRAERKERITDLLADATSLTKKTMFRYTKLRGEMDREISAREKKGSEAVSSFIDIRDEFISRRDGLAELENRIERLNASNGSHKNLLSAIALRNEAQLLLTTSEEFVDLRSEFPAPKEVEGDRSHVPVSDSVAQCVSELNTAIDGLLKLSCSIIAAVMEVPGQSKPKMEVDPQVARVVVPLLQGAGSSIAAMQAFPLPGLRTRECYLMARAVVETMVNACFVLAKGRSAAKRAESHARQKSFRDLSRQSDIAGHQIRIGLDDLPNIEELEKIPVDLASYTTSSGKENYRWTPESVDERIKVVGEKFGKSVLGRLHTARFAVYRHSSEIVHGTLFGYLYFHGATLPTNTPTSQEKLAEHIADQHIYLLLSIVLATSAFIKSFHEAYGIDDIDAAATELVERVRKIEYLDTKSDSTAAADE